MFAAALCVVIVCLLEDENDEGIRKKKTSQGLDKGAGKRNGHMKVFLENKPQKSRRRQKLYSNGCGLLPLTCEDNIAKTSTKMR